MALRKSKKATSTAGAAAEKKQGAGSNLALMFVMMLAVFLAGAGMVIGYFKFMDPDRKEAKAGEKEQEEVQLSSMELGNMVVNLADPGGNHFLKLTITIEYPQDKKYEELIQEKKHHIIETVLLTLRQKSVDEIRPAGATTQLKHELITAINNRLNEQVVQNIYFTEYIVQ